MSTTIIPVPMIMPMGRSQCADCRCPCHDEPDPTFKERTFAGKAVSVLAVVLVLGMAGWGLSLLWRNGPMGCQDNDWGDDPCQAGDYFFGVLLTIGGGVLAAMLTGLVWSIGGIWAAPSKIKEAGK